MTVKRYDRSNGSNDLSGELVKYSDYATLLAERDALKSQVVNLAVELSEVEIIHTECVFITDELYEKCPPEVQKVIRSLAVMQMPSAKEAVENWQAQGVEKYAENLDTAAEDAERDVYDDAVKFLRSEASGVRLFAAQLRKGASND